MWHAGGMLKKYGIDTPRAPLRTIRGMFLRITILIFTSAERVTEAYVSVGIHASPDIVKA